MPGFAANLSMFFTELALPEGFGAARQAGFEGKEYESLGSTETGLAWLTNAR